MGIPFKKMHGAGNDFIVIKMDDVSKKQDLSQLAISMCHRHFGIGADGLLAVGYSSRGDFKMHYYNSDGSLASMCGNGIRCFAKFVFEEGLIDQSEFTIETLAGIKKVYLTFDETNKVEQVKVDMGPVVFNAQKIPVITDKNTFINEKIVVGNEEFLVSSVLMDIPHTIVFTNDLQPERVKTIGPLIEKHKIFPKGTNVNFVSIENSGYINVKTWERGAGYTLACGTGVCGVVGLAYHLGLVKNEVEVAIEGGIIKVFVDEKLSIHMKGPAQNICSGVYFN